MVKIPLVALIAREGRRPLGPVDGRQPSLAAAFEADEQVHHEGIHLPGGVLILLLCGREVLAGGVAHAEARRRGVRQE